MTSNRKKVLHVGCGPPNPQSLHKQFRGEEWEEIRLDINPDVEPDIVGSITDMSGVVPGHTVELSDDDRDPRHACA